MRSHAPTTQPANALQDAWIDGYNLIAPLASGSTSTVYRARGLDGRQVAVKLLDPGLANREAVVRNLLAELEVSARAEHPGIVEIHSASKTAHGVPYLVMECLEGEIPNASMAWADLIVIASQVAAAAAAIHAGGFVHCDLKPGNVLVLRDRQDGQPRAKLIDYGAARPTSAAASELISGTPYYMAPEQWAGAPTPKSDVYALGCMLYELWTGRPVFTGSLMQLELAHRHLPPTRPSVRAPGIDAALEGLILAALAKDPAQRPTMAEMAAELAEIAACETVPSRLAA